MSLNEKTIAPASSLQGQMGLVEQILATASARAAHPALVTPAGMVTYDALARLTAQVARGLVAAGYPDASRIGLLLPHGTIPILASIACLRAGLIFVHLDPRDPDERLKEILEDCSPTLIITDGTGTTRLAEMGACWPGATWEQVLQTGEENSATALPVPPPDALMYLFYTSGSTGKPKGVLQTQRNLLHFASTYADRLGIHEDDRLSLLYTLSFSAANLDLFPALLRGASVCLYELRALGIAELPAWISDAGITVLHTVPSVFRTLVNGTDKRTQLSSIRVVDLGGEAVYAADVLQARTQLAGGCRIFNHYAQTEAMVIAQHEVTADDLQEPDKAVPVGKPARQMQVSIQNEQGAPAAPGEIGEVVLHSAHVSPGYWGSFDSQAAPDPFRIRRFVSGDLGYLDAEGVLRCTGRRNQRVKIDGQSVHLEEVERALHRLDPVRQGVVIAVERSGGTVLKAYLELREGARIESAGIRDGLRAWLPAYMVPARITVLEALPRTQSGKIDRLTLARMAEAPDPVPGEDAEAVGAGQGMPGEIAAMFTELLGGTACTVDQDFFALGGSSLKAMELHMRLEQRYGRVLPLETLLLSATPRFLADVIATRSPTVAGVRRPLTLSLNTEGPRPALFLVHGYNGQAMVSREFVAITGKGRPLHAFQASGLDFSHGKHWTLEDIAATYVEAMLERSEGRPFALGGLCIGTYLAVEMARQLIARGFRLPPLFLFDPAPFNPGNRWLTRLFRRRQDDQARMDDQRRRIRNRVAQGRSLVNIEDVGIMEQAAKAGAAFLGALERHRVRRFDHPVILFASRHRAAEVSSPRSTVSRCLKNVSSRHFVGESHTDMLAPGNPAFAAAFSAELEALDQWAGCTDRA